MKDINTPGMRRLNEAVNRRRPENGFIPSWFILHGWTGQPDYRHKR